MKTTWKAELPLLALVAAMFVLGAMTWDAAPERIPVHWNLTGEVDRYGGKLEGLILVPALALLVYVLMLVLPRLDPGRANYERFAGAYYAIRVTVIATIAVIDGVIHLAMREIAVDVPRVVGLMVGGLFFVLGNLLGKIRPNWFVGIRTPWTLSSKRAWTQTHRLAGWVFVAGGIAIMAAGVLQTTVAAALAIAVIGGGLVWAAVYSYLVWRRDPDRVPPAGTLPSNNAE